MVTTHQAVLIISPVASHDRVSPVITQFGGDVAVGTRHLHRQLCRVRRDERGSSLVEFAFILPIFALMLFGLIDFGMVFGGYISLRSDVGAAARSASVDYIPPSCTTAPNPMLCTLNSDIGALPGVVRGSVKVAVTFPSGTVQVGQPVLVCARATLRSTSGLTSTFLNGHAITVSSETRLEQIPSYLAGTSSVGFTC